MLFVSVAEHSIDPKTQEAGQKTFNMSRCGNEGESLKQSINQTATEKYVPPETLTFLC